MVIYVHNVLIINIFMLFKAGDVGNLSLIGKLHKIKWPLKRLFALVNSKPIKYD